MRLLRNTILTATIASVAVIPLVHLFALGAIIGAVLCAILWRTDILAWAKRITHREP